MSKSFDAKFENYSVVLSQSRKEEKAKNKLELQMIKLEEEN